MGSNGGGLALLTNIPTPYRLPAFNRLSRSKGTQFQVWFIATSEPERCWRIPVEEIKFEWKLLTKDSNANSLLTGTKASAAVIAFLARSRPKAVICGGYNSLPAWVTFAWCKLFRRRFLLWIESNARDLRAPSQLRGWLKQRIVQGADGIIVPGQASAAYVRSLGAEKAKIYLAPNSVDNDFFARAAGQVDVACERMRRGFPPKLLLFVGRLVRAKGVFELLEAFRRASRILPSVGLMIVGDGPERLALEAICKDRPIKYVYFEGFRQQKELPYYYGLADLLVLPTYSDPWGLVVNEAFACGVPAIVSRVAGACDDLIVEGETGFAVDPSNVEELASKILRLLEDESLRARMGKNCRRLIQKYSAAACAEGLLAAATGRASSRSA